MDWFFDGLGTALISALLGGVVGGGVGSFITIRVVSRRSEVTQKQRAGDNARQVQIGRDSKGLEQ
ncbi:hypothetical protein NS283_16680 [Microbacterium testaceum]|nr:hypothetical protein NS283_16680 [Microbacterium testaceum]